MESEAKTNADLEMQDVPKAIFYAFLADLKTKDISEEVISNLKDILISDQPITESKIKVSMFVNSKL
jgi:hypothetical protein